ncbi:MAG: hypothetical protein ACRENL_05210 [Candidatus Dormibacteria bacterium]
MIRTLAEVPENVRIALRFAQALWPGDVVPGSEAVAIGWSPALVQYSVDELCSCLEALSNAHSKLPSKAEVLAELASRRTPRATYPVLPAPRQERAVHPSQLDCRARLRADAVRFHRASDGSISTEELAEIDAWVAEVGPLEQAKLARFGIDVAMTQPQREGGDISAAEAPQGYDVPAPASLDELAGQWLDRWAAADREEREQMAAATLTDELKAAIRRLSAARRTKATTEATT